MGFFIFISKVVSFVLEHVDAACCHLVNLACSCHTWGRNIQLCYTWRSHTTFYKIPCPPPAFEQGTKRSQHIHLYVEPTKHNDKFLLAIKVWPLHLLGKCIDWLVCCYDRELIWIRFTIASLTLSIECLTVATERASSRRCGKSDVVLTSNCTPLFFSTWSVRG